MSSLQSTTGSLGDSSMLLYNRQPFLDIIYPIPHRLVNFHEKEAIPTSNDVIKVGLNFYESVSSITVKNSQDVKINGEEINELKSILEGGVIYNGSSS